MIQEHCLSFLCFAPLDSSGQKFFGFSEYLAALALLVLAWTNADIRYRFRVATAPIPISKITFSMILVIGILTLLTDLWRAESWPVPIGNFISPAEWQAFLGLLFLITFVMWAWFAFIRPPVYSRWNAYRFASVVYAIVLKGSSTDLSVVVEEFWRSAQSLVRYSWGVEELKKIAAIDPNSEKYTMKGKLKPKTCAYETLLIIGDKRFCTHIVQNSPATALAIFKEIGECKKYNIPISTFARNVTAAAIRNKDSFIYQEVEGYSTGYLGHHKPVTKTLYGNYKMAEALDCLFDVAFEEYSSWDSEQWKAFNRIVLLCMKDYIEIGWIERHSNVLHRAIGKIADSVKDVYTLNGGGVGEYYKSKPYEKLSALIDFLREAGKILENVIPDKRFISKQYEDWHGGFHKLIADTMVSAVTAAASVKSPMGTCWSIQHNLVWSGPLSFRKKNESELVIQKIFLRLLLREITIMRFGPNYVGASVLGMMLNVMSLGESVDKNDLGLAPFHRLLLFWTRRNFDRLYQMNPEIMEACLPDAISYDAKNFMVIKTFEKGLSRDPVQRTFKVDHYVSDKAKRGKPRTKTR